MIQIPIEDHLFRLGVADNPSIYKDDTFSHTFEKYFST